MLATPQTLSLLSQQHTFPGAFVFKVIGANTAKYVAEVTAAIAAVTGGIPPSPHSRCSAQGKHQALTFTVHTSCAEQVLAVFAALRDVGGTRWVL